MTEEEKKDEKKTEKKEGFKLGAGHLVAVLIITYFAYASEVINPNQALMLSGVIVLAYIFFKFGLEGRFFKDTIEYIPPDINKDLHLQKIEEQLLIYRGIRITEEGRTDPEPEFGEKSSEQFNQHYLFKGTVPNKKGLYRIHVTWSAITKRLIRVNPKFFGFETQTRSWFGAKKFPDARDISPVRFYPIKPTKIKAVPLKTEEEKEEEEKENES